MSAPDVRVRLTPEGVAEVVSALKKVQAESAAANKSSAGGVGLVTQSLRELKQLLPTIGLAAFVAGFVGLTKRAIESADATGKLQQKVGGTTEDISALTLAFRQNNSNQEELAQLLRQTTLRMDELRTGSAQVPEELSRIGVTIDDIRGLDAPRVFELIATRLNNIRDPAERAALATGIFKKNAADLIPALNAVGSQGIDQLIKKARELGIVIGSDLADAAARANDALGDLKLRAEGLATQFVVGFAPQIAGAFEDIGTAINRDGTDNIEAFGRVVGTVVRSVIFLFTSLGKIIGAVFAAASEQVTGFTDALKALATANPKAFVDAVKRTFSGTNEIRRSLIEDLSKDFEAISTPPPPKERPRQPAGSTSAVPAVTPEDKRIADARTAFLKSQLENELAIQKASIQARQDIDSAAYAQGLISLEEYYRRRKALAQQAADAEIAALKAQRRAVLAAEGAEIQKLTQQREATRAQALGQPGTPQAARAAGAGGTSSNATNLDADLQARRLKLREQIADIDAKIQVREIEAAREQQQLTEQERVELRQVSDERVKVFAQLDELEGHRHEAFESNLALEVRDLKELLTRAGSSQQDIDSAVQRLTRARTTTFDFEEVSRRGKAALDSFNRDADQIRRDQEAGVITQLTGENRLIELERSRLDVLKQLAAEALKAAQATGDPDQIEQAERYSDSVKAIEASFKAATDAVAKFRNGFSEGLQTGLEDLFNSTDKIRSLGDAWRKLGDTILSTLRRVAAELLSKQITRGIEQIFDSLSSNTAAASATSAGGGGGGKSFLGSLGSLLGALFGGGARDGGLQQVRRFAAGGSADATAGGLTRGPGTGTSDSIPAIVGGRQLVRIANREYIVRNHVVEQPGALGFLHQFNKHGMAMLRAPRFATGGLMSAAIAAAPAAASYGGSWKRPLQVNQNISAQTREEGRRTAKQSGLELARALRRAEQSNG